MSSNDLCPNCYKGTPRIFFEAKGVPTNSCILLDSKKDAMEYPQGEIALGFCEHCGFIHNTAMDLKLTEYSGRYEETQGFSPTFSSFHKRLAEDVKEKFSLHGKKIIEIGCGKGEFLMLLCESDENEGVGFDPSYIPARNEAEGDYNVRFVTDFYSEKYTDEKADFICCKMTLEHIPETHKFIEMVRSSIGEGNKKAIFFMVPESIRILDSCAFEDVYYEHCSYFTPYSLSYLFEQNDFDVDEVFNLYDGQYLSISATSNKSNDAQFSNPEELKKLSQLVAEFPEKLKQKTDYWKEAIQSRHQDGKKIVIWGSGSKGVAFLSTLGVGDQISYAVDINPHRQGYFMPTSGHEIVSPDFLKELKPDTVVVMNSIYVDEIQAQLNGLSLKPEILAL